MSELLHHQTTALALDAEKRWVSSSLLVHTHEGRCHAKKKYVSAPLVHVRMLFILISLLVLQKSLQIVLQILFAVEDTRQF